MESEKVKEIKEILKKRIENINPWETHALEYHKGLLDYINELESENERLTKQYVDWKDLYYENTKRVKKLKDRIVELEKENKDYYDRLNNLQTYIDNHAEIWKVNTKTQLKQFAERLKEKLKARHGANRLLLMPVRDVVLSTIEGVFEDVDKTLKEFINE